MKAKQERQEPCAEINSLCSLNKWSVEYLFLHAARKFSPELRRGKVVNDAMLFIIHANASKIPEYVQKYINMEYVIRKKKSAARQREYAQMTEKKFSPVYIHPSPARMRQ